MTGIFLLGVIAIWSLILWSLSVVFSKIFSIKRFEAALRIVFMVVLLPLPLADEIIGRTQFHALCRATAQVQLHPSREFERNVITGAAGFEKIDTLAVPVTAIRFTMLYEKSGEVAFSYLEPQARGGWLARSLGLTESPLPYTFSPICPPDANPSISLLLKKFGLINIR